MPRVSVLLPVHNGERFVGQALESILGQTFGDFDVIVVNDASTDRSAEIVSSYCDSRIRMMTNERNIGVASSLNKAAWAARSELLARQDADDLACPLRLFRQVEWLERNPSAGVLGTNVIVVDENGRECGFCEAEVEDDIDIKWALLFENVFMHSSLMFRRSVLMQVGGYAEGPERAFVEDYDLLSRMSRVSATAILPEFLQKYRVNPRGVSLTNSSEQRRQAQEVAQSNVRWLLGSQNLSEMRWRGLRAFMVNWAPLTYEEAAGAIGLSREIQSAFAARYLVAERARSHRRLHYLKLARRAFAQARRNPHLGYGSRLYMFGIAAALAAKARVGTDGA